MITNVKPTISDFAIQSLTAQEPGMGVDEIRELVHRIQTMPNPGRIPSDQIPELKAIGDLMFYYSRELPWLYELQRAKTDTERRRHYWHLRRVIAMDAEQIS